MDRFFNLFLDLGSALASCDRCGKTGGKSKEPLPDGRNNITPEPDGTLCADEFTLHLLQVEFSDIGLNFGKPCPFIGEREFPAPHGKPLEVIDIGVNTLDGVIFASCWPGENTVFDELLDSPLGQLQQLSDGLNGIGLPGRSIGHSDYHASMGSG